MMIDETIDRVRELARPDAPACCRLEPGAGRCHERTAG
jgi:hypothetical protein